MPVESTAYHRARFFDGFIASRDNVCHQFRGDNDNTSLLKSIHSEEYGSAQYTRLYGMSMLYGMSILAYAVTLIIMASIMIAVTIIGFCIQSMCGLEPIITSIVIDGTPMIPVRICYFAMACVNS